MDPAARSLSILECGGRRVPDWSGCCTQKRVMMGLCQPKETGPQLRVEVSSCPHPGELRSACQKWSFR